MTSSSGLDDLRRRNNLEPFVKRDGGVEKKVRATVDEDCVKCGHHQIEYYTMQLRSADEGQTVFYECPKCKHKWSINN